MKCGFLPALIALAAGTLAQEPEADRSNLRLLPPGSHVAVVAAQSSGGSDVDRVVNDMLVTALRQAGMRVVERQSLDAILQEQRLAREGLVDPSTAMESGKLLGADYLIHAKATEFGVRDERVGGAFGLGQLGGLQIRTSTARVVIDVRVLDVQTGRVLATQNGEGRQSNQGATLIGGSLIDGRLRLGAIDIGGREWSQSMLGKASRKAVETLTRKLTGRGDYAPEGRVIAVSPKGEIVLDIGAFDGVRAGDRMRAVRLDPIRDSKGVAVWLKELELGSIRIVEVRGDRAIAEALPGTEPIREGDLAKAGRD